MYVKSHSINALTHTIIMVQSIGGILLTVGGVGLLASIFFLSTLDYNGPPIPAGYLVGLIAITLGAGVTLGASLLSWREKKPTWITIAILAAAILVYGILETAQHPLELPDCPCPPNYYGAYPCVPCPQTDKGICNGKGTCDEGITGTGTCYCDIGYGGEACEQCAPTFQGNMCNQCKRNWAGEHCDRCYPGYTGHNCDSCAAGFLTQQDILGVLCRRCKPGFYGPYCKSCRDCTKHDPIGTCRDNEWHETNRYDPKICTAQGNTCSDKFDCASNNCKGTCTIGDSATGQLCEYDEDCFPGTCEFKQCCLEARHGDGHCECGSIGHYGENCEACPGFDGVYSSTICAGHGTCTEEYAAQSYTGLRCACAESWSGELCACRKDNPTDSNCTECASGAYGPQCRACNGGVGVAQCNTHGVCSDGLEGDGTCTCDVDVKYGGIGAFKGEACESCLSEDFYGDNCRTCPNLKVVQCIPGLNLTQIPGVGQCIQSCGSKTCNNKGFCV